MNTEYYDDILIVAESDFCNDTQKFFDYIDETNRSIIIERPGGKRLVMMCWEKYMDKFGCLYTDEQIDELEKMIKRCKDK